MLVFGGYLVRSASARGANLEITGDFNETARLEIVAPPSVKYVSVNGRRLIEASSTAYGTKTVTVIPHIPGVNLPDLQNLTWRVADSLPELSTDYSDDKWVTANVKLTSNPNTPLAPVSLYGGDYGYHHGIILWRGHFRAFGGEAALSLNIYGGTGFGYAAYDNGHLIQSWLGSSNAANHSATAPLPTKWIPGERHVNTVVQDHMGYSMSWTANTELYKEPRGIFEYGFFGANGSVLVPKSMGWKVQGNLGGEDVRAHKLLPPSCSPLFFSSNNSRHVAAQLLTLMFSQYVDRQRGPFNEGGLYGERKGWHLPSFPDQSWNKGSPMIEISGPGVRFYRTTFQLHLPDALDAPISIQLPDIGSTKPYRALIYMNGFQFGRYVSSLGPQTKFPIPPSVLNRSGENTLVLAVWCMSEQGASVETLSLQVDAKIEYGGPHFENQVLGGYEKEARGHAT